MLMVALVAVNNEQQNVSGLKGHAAARAIADEITADAVDNCLTMITNEIKMFFARLEEIIKQMVTSENVTGRKIVSYLLQTDIPAALTKRINIIFFSLLQARFNVVQADAHDAQIKYNIEYNRDILPPLDWFSEADSDRRQTHFLQKLMSALAKNSIELAIDTLSVGNAGGKICKRLHLDDLLFRLLMDKAGLDTYTLETTREIQGWLDCTRILVLRQTKQQIVNTFYKLHDAIFY